MHTLAKNGVILALLVCLTITSSIAADAADFRCELTAKEKELYEYYAPPVIPTDCEHCGGVLEESSYVTSPFGTTGLTKTCARETVYTGLDIMQARRVLITYICKDCEMGVTTQGYERRWICWDEDGCKNCGGRRFLQNSVADDWALTGNIRDCDDGGFPYYQDAEAERVVNKVFACEDCGTIEARSDYEKIWLCTADEDERLIVSELM